MHLLVIFIFLIFAIFSEAGLSIRDDINSIVKTFISEKSAYDLIGPVEGSRYVLMEAYYDSECKNSVFSSALSLGCYKISSSTSIRFDVWGNEKKGIRLAGYYSTDCTGVSSSKYLFFNLEENICTKHHNGQFIKIISFNSSRPNPSKIEVLHWPSKTCVGDPFIVDGILSQYECCFKINGIRWGEVIKFGKENCRLYTYNAKGCPISNLSTDPLLGVVGQPIEHPNYYCSSGPYYDSIIHKKIVCNSGAKLGTKIFSLISVLVIISIII